MPEAFGRELDREVCFSFSPFSGGNIRFAYAVIRPADNTIDGSAWFSCGL
jgi:hypothetical protein